MKKADIMDKYENVVNLDEFRMRHNTKPESKIIMDKSVEDYKLSFSEYVEFLTQQVVCEMRNEFPEMDLKANQKIVYDILEMEQQFASIFHRATGQYHPQHKINDSKYSHLIPNPTVDPDDEM